MKSKISKVNLKTIWDWRHFTVRDCLNSIKHHPELKFLLTSVGVWFFVRWTFSILFAVHLLKFVGRIFSMVLG